MVQTGTLSRPACGSSAAACAFSRQVMLPRGPEAAPRPSLPRPRRSVALRPLGWQPGRCVPRSA